MSSSNSTSGPTILNPNEPFAYLPPDIAHEIHVLAFVVVASLGMFAWECILDLPNLYRLFIKERPTIPAVVYLISRVGVVNFSVAGILINVTGARNCEALPIYLGVSWIFASPATAMLFFFRIKALYKDSLIVIGFFTIAWLAVLASAITVAVALGNKAVHVIPTSDFCVQTVSFPPYASASFIVPTVYDTLVFFFVSYRLFPSYEIEGDSTWKTRIRLFFNGKGLPRLSKALLQGGQQYYLVSVIMNIFALVLYLAGSLPIPYHVLLANPLQCVVNAVACKVYRDIRFGRLSAEATYGSSNAVATLSTVRAAKPIPYHHARRNAANVFVDVTTTRDTEATRSMEEGSGKGIRLGSFNEGNKNVDV